jgi:RNA polymerase-binding transcription factor DksA
MDNTVTRYSDEDLQEFKALIDAKLESARNELNFMQEQVAELNENASEKQGGNWFDDSSLHTEIEMLNGMVIRQQQFINNLENALIRIKNKTYGICSVTGQLIDKKRLLLVPHATKSVIAKEIENAEKAKQEAIAKAEKEQKEREKLASEKKETKIISKIIKKPSTKTAEPKPSASKGDDYEDLDLELELEDDDSDYDEDMVNDIDMDEIPDDQEY